MDTPKKVFELAHDLYSENSPVMVLAGILLNYSESGRSAAHIRFRNMTEQPIVRLELGIAAHDAQGRELAGTAFCYDQLYAEKNAEFGADRPVLLPDNNTASFVIRELTVTFADGTQTAAVMPLLPIAAMIKEQPVIEQPVAEQPVAEQPVAEQPVAEQPVIEQPVIEQPVAEQPEAASKEAVAQKQEAFWNHKDDDEEEEEEAPKKKSVLLKILLILVPIAILAVVGVFWFYPSVLQPSMEYKDAVALMESGEYEAAADAFAALGDYKDSAEMEKESLYLLANEYMYESRYDEAIDIYEDLGDYKDSAEMIDRAGYEQVYMLAEAGDYEAAIEMLEEMDAEEEEINSMYYDYADHLWNDLEDAAGALEIYEKIPGYLDSDELAKDCVYYLAMMSFEGGMYEEAMELFLSIEDHGDAADMANICRERLAEQGVV